MVDPLVSIVIPVYNQAEYLDLSIRSVLGQRYQHIQCIVVDDGSTDGSHSVAQKYGAKVLLLQQANAGQAAALNNGFAHAAGDFIGYLSSDDCIDALLVERLVAWIGDKANGGPAVAFPRYRTIDEHDAVVNPECPHFEGVRHMVESFRCNIGPGAIFSKEVLQVVRGWNPAFRQIPDYEFWLRAAAVATFHELPQVLASFRVHGTSQTYARHSSERSDESMQLLHNVMEGTIALPAGPDIRVFGASACMYSSCLHLRSGRFAAGARRYGQAFRHSRRATLGMQAIKRLARCLIAGTVHR